MAAVLPGKGLPATVRQFPCPQLRVASWLSFMTSFSTADVTMCSKHESLFVWTNHTGHTERKSLSVPQGDRDPQGLGRGTLSARILSISVACLFSKMCKRSHSPHGLEAGPGWGRTSPANRTPLVRSSLIFATSIVRLVFCHRQFARLFMLWRFAPERKVGECLNSISFDCGDLGGGDGLSWEFSSYCSPRSSAQQPSFLSPWKSEKFRNFLSDFGCSDIWVTLCRVSARLRFHLLSSSSSSRHLSSSDSELAGR